MGLQEKFEELINEAEVDIPKSHIDRASASYVIDLKKTKKNKQAVILKFTTFRNIILCNIEQKN